MRVLANDGLSREGIELLEKEGIEVISENIGENNLADYINDHQIDVLLVRSATQVTQELIEEAPGLKVIGRCGVGLDNIDVDYAKEMGLIVINTPGASSRAVAELVFAHFFSLARNLHEANRRMPMEGDSNFEGLKKSFKNAFELQGKTLGIIGMGKIGTEVAAIGISLGMKILYHSRSTTQREINLEFYDGQKVHFKLEASDLDTVISQSDFISINTPKTNEYLLDEAQYQKMKKGVFIVNAARGGVINEKALLKSMQSGMVAGAALDVFEQEPYPEISLLMHPGLSLSPHLGGNTIDAQNKIGIEIAKRLIKINNDNATI